MAKPLLQTAFSISILFFTMMMFQLTLPYLSFRSDVDFLLTKQHLIANRIWTYAFYLHITASIWVLLAGAVQFNRDFRKKYPKFHKLIGKTYVAIVLCISAPTGLVMAVYANGGIWAKISFVLISIFWWLFTWKGFAKIKESKITGHQHWMYRSYALTLSAVSLRLYSLVLPHLFHLNGRQQYILIAWLSWTINLLLVEVMIWRTKNQYVPNLHLHEV